MNATIERIKEDIRNLAPEEVDHLLRDLQQEYVMSLADEGDEAALGAAWDAEIVARVREVEEGKVELISGDALRRGTNALFAELGIQRPA